MAGFRTGAVVIGGDYNGLGTVRSLGRRGIPVVVVDDEPSISRFSRYTRESIRVDSLREEPEIVANLLDVARRLGLEGWVLYPTRDEIVAAISRRRDDLATVYRVPTPPFAAIRWAWDKRLTYQIACELGIPTPRTWHWHGADAVDLESLAGALPLVIKPAIKENFIYETKVKAWRADTPADLERQFHRACRIIPPEEVMIQELVPGDGSSQLSYCAFYKDGEARASMTVRRRRQRPADFGRSSTYVETVDAPEIAAMSRELLGRIGYYGLVEVEFKHDARDGLFKLLDINARTWGYHSLGQAAGVDFPYLLFQDQLEQPFEDAWAIDGVHWLRLSTDLPMALNELVHRRLAWRTYLASLQATDVEAVFQRDDLRPALAEIALLPYLYRTRGMSRTGGDESSGT